MSLFSLTTREKEILQLLRIIYPERKKYTLIGGYAVAAYAPLPRYSVDCDLVISKSDFIYFSDIFAKNDFRAKSQIFLDELTGLETWKFKKKVDHEIVTIELSLDGVKCRQTDALWVQQEIKSNREIGQHLQKHAEKAIEERVQVKRIHNMKRSRLKSSVQR